MSGILIDAIISRPLNGFTHGLSYLTSSDKKTAIDTKLKLIISRINLDRDTFLKLSEQAKKGQKRTYPQFQEIITISPWNLSPRCEFWYKPTEFGTGTRYEKLCDIFWKGDKNPIS